MSRELHDPKTDANVTLTSLEQTCFACPSQWEARTDRDEHVFIHYRWGHLTIDVTPRGWPRAIEALQKDLGDAMSGVIQFDPIAHLVARAVANARAEQYA